MNVFSSVGTAVRAVTKDLCGVLALLYDTLYWIFVGPFRRKFPRADSIFHQMVFTGVRSLVIVFFVGLFTGIVIAMQSAYQFKKLGAILYVPALVSVSMCRELGPVLTALVIAGRVGSAIAAELGTMKVTEQIEALETIALHPVRFLVVPRFLALVAMLPCLTMLSDVVGMLGGYIVGVFKLGITPGLYATMTFKFLTTKDVMTGLLKSVVFAVIIALIGCYQGLNTSEGAEGVGKATTVSVVTSFILVILADCLLTALFYFSNV